MGVMPMLVPPLFMHWRGLRSIHSDRDIHHNVNLLVYLTAYRRVLDADG